MLHSSRLCSMLFVSSWSCPLFRRAGRLTFAPAMTKRPDLTFFVPVLTFQIVISKPHAPLRQTQDRTSPPGPTLGQGDLAVPVFSPLTPLSESRHRPGLPALR